MEGLEVKISKNTLTVVDGNGERTIALPLDLAQQVDPDQWLNNFRRRLRYACSNVGWEVGPEQQAEMVKQIVTTEIVKQKIEQGDNAFWKDRSVAERREWFYDNGFEECPPEGRKELPPDGDEKGKTPPPVGKGNWLLPIAFGLIAILAIGYYFWPKENEPVVTPSPPIAEDLLEDAVSLLYSCLSVEGRPGRTLENSMTKDTFLMIDFPFRRALKKVIEKDGLEDSEAIRKVALKIINERTEKWQRRCDCKLINDCESKD
jgi:hypothetical protein